MSDLLTSEDERDGRADPEEIVIYAIFHRDVRNLLDERATRVIERRFGLSTGDVETLDGIAADYGITRERIRQIQGQSIKKLRMSRQVAALRSYLVDDSKAHQPAGSAQRKAS